MSGHSKWSNMRYRKASQDNKKDKIFSKIIKELHSVIKISKNINPKYNSKLRLIIEKALSVNMSRSVINNILEKKKDNKKLKEIYYEGYGPDNIAIMISCLTDNNNRTVSFIRNILNKIGGNLKPQGAVSYIFKKKIFISYLYKNNLNDIIDIAEKLKAEDILLNKKIIQIIFSKKRYKILTKEIKNFKIKPIKIKLIIKPFIKKKINVLTKNKLIDFLSLCKKCEDIKNVYHDAEI
ncbi:YebC/PmpR family DNA-binding transcriptional regulator [Enterobacteriaceae endosymbiont of Donacia thalassina]|uniref:YebC/PmpR family DNA-binding transcriptional regulator n=1 Tax=Enterobacteriaceae endosymbiont of Donacia thalassina TaxID=2675786 RepID=UPI00144952F9|nr:YebC/PmpR family DNA-binding transcriptional regulator [Enterobacteriaceae endosymbiont of Donacia thalassina]QJC37508.1 YebC/PmpR family DNA-binding transcriptional regulator [Enterobacteriaceae endosymbiont of Donacia thalassina]